VINKKVESGGDMIVVPSSISRVNRYYRAGLFILFIIFSLKILFLRHRGEYLLNKDILILASFVMMMVVSFFFLYTSIFMEGVEWVVTKEIIKRRRINAVSSSEKVFHVNDLLSWDSGVSKGVYFVSLKFALEGDFVINMGSLSTQLAIVDLLKSSVVCVV